MIWLSPMTGTAEGSIYFEIRDISLKRTARGDEGLVRGLLGDGRQELWGEIHLGPTSRVEILPQWNDDGEIDFIAEPIDVELLKSQLLVEVVAAVATRERCYPQHSVAVNSPRTCEAETPYSILAA